MGKKGKKGAKQQAADGGAKQKVGPGKARRERAAKLRDLEARIEALAEKLDVELEGVDVFSPLEERDECPICLTILPLSRKKRFYLPCCRNSICRACSDHQGIHEMFKLKKCDDVAAIKKALEETPCPLCRSDYRKRHKLDHLANLAEERVDTEAMMLLGEVNFGGGSYGGESVPKDKLSALGWFVRAAESGHPMALARVAIACYQREIARSFLAEKLALAAAKRGCHKAHDLLAFIYMRLFVGKQVGLKLGFCVDFGHQFSKEKFLDHWKFATSGGCRDSLEHLEEYALEMHGIITKEEFHDIQEEFEKAAKLEWTEEREEWSKDGFEERFIGKLLEQRRQRVLAEVQARAEEQAREGGS